MSDTLENLKKRKRELEDDKTLLEHAKPEVVETPELDAIRDENAELVRDNKRRKFEVDQTQAVDDLAFIEKQKSDPKCISPLHGDFTKLCQKDIPESFGKALLCPFHNSKCTPGVKDSVLKKALSKYRYGKKDQQTAFDKLALERQLLQGVATAAQQVVTGMTNLTVQQSPQPIQQVIKREQVFDIKVEHPKITVEELEAMKDRIEVEAKEQRKLGKDYYNITQRRSRKSIVDETALGSAIAALKQVVDPDNTLPVDQVLPAMRKVVAEMITERDKERARERRAEPPRPAGVKAQ